MGMADSFFCHSERRAKPGVEESVSPYRGVEVAGGSRPSPTGWCVGEGFNPPVPGVKTALGGGRAIDKPLRCGVRIFRHAEKIPGSGASGDYLSDQSAT